MGNVRLFVACVAIWGSTWLAIKFQLGRVAPEASVFYRFLLASVIIFGYCVATRRPLRFPVRQHLWLVLLGTLMFSVSYIFVYYAERHVVSGLVAVGYSASPLLAMLGMRAFFGTPMTRRVIAGSILGIVGIALVFRPEFERLHGDGDTVLGAFYTIASVLVASLGSLVAHRNHEARIPLWQGMAWSMLYGSLVSLGVALALGQHLGFELTPGYILSLVYLAVLGSIIAFGAYLTLIKRVGAARAGYIGVMVPIVALVVSAAFEGFEWHVLTFVGIAISVAGNVIVLRGK